MLPYVCLVRHGETAWSASGQHTGRTDIPLTDRGEEAARALQVRLAEMSFSDVFTSPLQRARRTCELAGFGALAKADPDLVEWGYGEYEGRRTAEILAADPTWRPFEAGYPGGETAADVGVRADRIISRARACSGNVLLFGHRDMFRILAARWLQFAPIEGRRFYLDTGGISVLGYDHNLNEPAVRLWNGR